VSIALLLAKPGEFPPCSQHSKNSHQKARRDDALPDALPERSLPHRLHHSPGQQSWGGCHAGTPPTPLHKMERHNRLCDYPSGVAEEPGGWPAGRPGGWPGGKSGGSAARKLGGEPGKETGGRQVDGAKPLGGARFSPPTAACKLARPWP
jgi:hypothetical protein